MKRILEVIGDMTPPHRRLLASSSVAVIFAAFWVLGYRPLFERISSIEEEVEALSSEQRRLEAAQRFLPTLTAEISVLKEKLARARDELPDQREIPDLLSSVSDRAKDAGLEVNLFRPTEEVFRDFYAEVPVFFSVRGNYHQIARFFDDVGKLDRIVTVSGVSIKESSSSRSVEGARAGFTTKSAFKVGPGDKEGSQQTETGCTVTTFRILDEEERQRSVAARRDVKAKKRL